MMNDVVLIHKENPTRYMVTFGMHVGMHVPARSVVEWRYSLPDDCWFAFCKTHGTCADACTVRVTAHRKSIGLADDK